MTIDEQSRWFKVKLILYSSREDPRLPPVTVVLGKIYHLEQAQKYASEIQRHLDPGLALVIEPDWYRK